jgi:hypothetical protein
VWPHRFCKTGDRLKFWLPQTPLPAITSVTKQHGAHIGWRGRCFFGWRGGLVKKYMWVPRLFLGSGQMPGRIATSNPMARGICRKL